MDGNLVDGVSQVSEFTRKRFNQAGYGFQKGGLAGAVDPQEGQPFSLVYNKLYVPKNLQTLIPGAYMSEFKHAYRSGRRPLAGSRFFSVNGSPAKRRRSFRKAIKPRGRKRTTAIMSIPKIPRW